MELFQNDKKFTLLLTDEAKNILNEINRKERTEFINNAIIAYYRNNKGRETFENALLQVIKNIEKHLAMLNQNIQKLHLNTLIEQTAGNKEKCKQDLKEINEKNREKLKRFIRSDIDLDIS